MKAISTITNEQLRQALADIKREQAAKYDIDLFCNECGWKLTGVGWQVKQAGQRRYICFQCEKAQDFSVQCPECGERGHAAANCDNLG